MGRVDLTLTNEDSTLGVEVRDDGLGLPEGFDIERTTSLGLSIVRDLVVSQLEGTISMQAMPPADGGGTSVEFPCRCGRPDDRGRRLRRWRAQKAARCERRAASHALRSLRRSSSDVPPQTPDS